MGNLWLALFLGGSKITAHGDCSHEIKRCLLLGRKVMTNLDSILKNRDITLPTKVRLVKALIFPVVVYGCESWIIRKMRAEELMLLTCGVGEDSWEGRAHSRVSLCHAADVMPSAVILTSFLLLTYDLICSSFSSFLRWELRLLILDIFFTNVYIHSYNFPT